MKKFLWLFIFMLAYSICFAHTVVLKNGTKVEGEEIQEKDGSLWIMQKSDKEKTGWDYSKADVYPLIDIASVDGVVLDEAESYYKLANFYTFKENKYEQAISFYKKAIGLKPNFENAVVNLILCYNKAGRIQDTIDLGEKAIIDFPNAPEIPFNLAVAYAVSYKDDKAILHYNKAIELNPKFAESYANLGMLYYSSGKYKEAQFNLLKSKELLASKGDKALLEKVDELLSKVEANIK